jgi:DNA-binding NtrC family response regulator
MSQKQNILIVDDDEKYLKSLKAILERKFGVIMSTSLEDAKGKINRDIEIILLDIRLDENDSSNKDGLLLLEYSKKNFPEIPVVMMSGYKEFDLAVDSLNLGASYFLRKPINRSELNAILKTIVEKNILSRENIELKEKLKKYEH